MVSTHAETQKKISRPRKPITVELCALPDEALVARDITEAVSGLKNSRRCELINEGRFPAPIKLSPRCARWRMGDLRRWLADPLGYGETTQVNGAK